LRTALVLFGLVGLGIAPATATAATMTIDAAPSVRIMAVLTVTTSGTADQGGHLYFSVLPASSACPPNQRTQSGGSGGSRQSAQVAPGGSYSFTEQIQIFQGGPHRICGYLSPTYNDEPEAQDDALVTVETDPDNDGVFGDADKCPNERGVDERNNQATADGCPIRDADRDGVRDEDDHCPNVAGFNSGTGQYMADGCPRSDTDHDGLSDQDDRCPNEQGLDSRTGQRTADGCPVRYDPPSTGGGGTGPAPRVPVADPPPEAPTWMRFVGGANVLDLYYKGREVNQLGFVCSTSGNAGCVFKGSTVTIKVSAAVQRKYKLPSRTIATADEFGKKGSIMSAPVTVTSAMLARLKRAKVKKLATTVTLKAVGSVPGTVNKKLVFFVGRMSKTAKYERFCIGTAKDKLCGPNGDLANEGS
jgi:hypothetical protein